MARNSRMRAQLGSQADRDQRQQGGEMRPMGRGWPRNMNWEAGWGTPMAGGGGAYMPEQWPGEGYIDPAQFERDYGPRHHRQRFEERDDDEIKNEIYDALDDDPSVPPAADIRVDVQDGVVTLTGSVRNRSTKFAAGDCAWHTPGVHDVHNNVAVMSRRREFRTPPQENRGRKAA
jgi:hypothetical protein